MLLPHSPEARQLIEKSHQLVKSLAKPAHWSKGISLSRSIQITNLQITSDEVAARVSSGGLIANKVQIWPHDDDVYCSQCESETPCEHAVALVIALKNQQADASNENLNSSVTPKPAVPMRSSSYVEYLFLSRHHKEPLSNTASQHYPTLYFGRRRVWKSPSDPTYGGTQPLVGSLTSVLSQSKSGQIPGPPLSTSQADFQIDYWLADLDKTQPFVPHVHDTFVYDGIKFRKFTSKQWAHLAHILSELGSGEVCQYRTLTIGSESAGLFSNPTMQSMRCLKFSLKPKIILQKNNQDFRAIGIDAFSGSQLEGLTDVQQQFLQKTWNQYGLKKIVQIFSDHVALFEGVNEFILVTGESWRQGDSDTKNFLGNQWTKNRRQVAQLIGEQLPVWRSLYEVDDSGAQPLPIVKKVAPEVELHMERISANEISVTARMRLPEENTTDILLVDEDAQRALTRQLRAELHLAPNEPVRFKGSEQVSFLERSQSWRVKIAEKSAVIPSQKSLPKVKHVEFIGWQQSPKLGGDWDASLKVIDSNHNETQWFLSDLLSVSSAPQVPPQWLLQWGERLSDHYSSKGGHSSHHRQKNWAMYGAVQGLVNVSENESNNELFEKMIKNGFFGKLIDEQKLNKNYISETLIKLRHYQQQGVQWLNALSDLGAGGLLADEMGLGKTIQILSVLNGNSLIIVPTSLLWHWVDQLKRLRSDLKVYIYHGPQRVLPAFEGEKQSCGIVVVTTYGVCRMDHEKLSESQFDYIIADETQNIKNADSQAAQALFSLKGKVRFALTGTPIENRWDDLWSQYRFVLPGLLPSKSDFLQAPQAYLKAIKPFLLRRTKKEVATDLPSRTEVILPVQLSENELSIYSDIAKIRTQPGFFDNTMQGLELLLRLRQVCCDTRLLKDPALRQNFSTKLAVLVERLEVSLEAGHKCLIFSQWTSLLDLVEDMLVERGWSYGRIDGTGAYVGPQSMSRQAAVTAFQQNPDHKVMLLSLKAAGVGLNLTAADHVYILDPWWNPAVEDQAADRAHRIGQDRPVFIFKLVAKGTVEEKILQLQNEKRLLAQQVLDESIDTIEAFQLSRDELKDLLTP